MGNGTDIDLVVPTPQEADRLRQQGVQLPRVSAQTADPRNHSDYVEQRILGVGFGIYIGGYLLFCKGVATPLMVSDAYVDLTETKATPVNLAIFDDYRSAMAPIPYGPPAPNEPEPYDYYYAAGGRSDTGGLIVPTLFCPATTPITVATMIGARRMLAQEVERELVTIAIGIVGGMVLRAVFAGIARVAGRTLSVPAVRIRPVNGTVNVGGGFEGTPNAWTNLNPFLENTGGPAANASVPNLVRARFEDMGDIFETGSVNKVISQRLPAATVDWPQAANGAYRVMSPGGKLSINVWTSSPQEVQDIMQAFTRAGFRQVKNITGYVGPGTVIEGIRP